MKKSLAFIIILLAAYLPLGCASVSMTPLGNAAQSGDLESVKSLLSNGANSCQKNESGLTSYMWSFEEDELKYDFQRTCKKNEPYDLLMENAYEVLSKGGDCPSLLHFAAASGCTDIVKKLLEKGGDIESKMQDFTPLGWAALYKQEEIAKLLVSKGADVDVATLDLKNHSEKSRADNIPHLNSYIRSMQPIILMMLKVEAARVKRNAQFMAAEKINEDLFQKAIPAYQKAATKPELSEEARKYKIQAESAVRDKDFADAANRYEQALRLAPWWAEGHFNRALVLGEAKEFAIAVIEMKRYLLLTPKAPNARAAQDKIYEWERKVPN